jgi:hypothetical protein
MASSLQRSLENGTLVYCIWQLSSNQPDFVENLYFYIVSKWDAVYYVAGPKKQISNGFTTCILVSLEDHH